MLRRIIIVAVLLLIAAPCFALTSEQEQSILGGQGQAQGGVTFYSHHRCDGMVGFTGYQAQIAGATTGQGQYMNRGFFDFTSGEQSQSTFGVWHQEQYRESLIGVGEQSQSSCIGVFGHQSQSTGFAD